MPNNQNARIPSSRPAATLLLRTAAAAALTAGAMGHAQASSLLGLYTFEGANGSFANVVDVSGNGKNPVSFHAGSVSVTTGGQGYQGEAAQFRPTSGNAPNIGFEVAIDIAPSLGDLTIGGWLKWQPTTNTTNVHNGGTSGRFGYGLNSFFGHDNGCWDRGLWYGDEGWEITGAANCGGPRATGAKMSAEAWHFVAVSYAGTNASLYINGVLQATGQSHDSGGGSPRLRIGAFDFDGTSEPWDGLMDNVFITRSALTADQIGTIQRNGVAGILAVTAPAAVPEPGSLALVALAGASLLLTRRRRG
jgi:Concanavalin A-like lectin/glucanases superfamily/PEP-CTERM motif